MEASIGYEASAAIAKEQIESGRDIRDIVRERNLLPEADLEEILKPRAMTEPGIAGQGRTRTPILGGGGGGGSAGCSLRRALSAGHPQQCAAQGRLSAR